jgi:nucleotide-binding universal stress UspA family protein
MLPLEKIICPIDFSEPSYAALRAAEELALHFTAQLVLVHVVDLVPLLPATSPVLSPPGASRRLFDVAAYQEALQRSAERQLEEAARQRVSGEVELRRVIVAGTPANMIVELAARERADLIVIATHGRTGVRRLLSGSVAEKVVRTAGCPVLAIRSPEEEDR